MANCDSHPAGVDDCGCPSRPRSRRGRAAVRTSGRRRSRPMPGRRGAEPRPRGRTAGGPRDVLGGPGAGGGVPHGEGHGRAGSDEARAVSTPMPEDAPVTIAVRPVRSMPCRPARRWSARRRRRGHGRSPVRVCSVEAVAVRRRRRRRRASGPARARTRWSPRACRARRRSATTHGRRPCPGCRTGLPTGSTRCPAASTAASGRASARPGGCSGARSAAGTRQSEGERGEPGAHEPLGGRAAAPACRGPQHSP